MRLATGLSALVLLGLFGCSTSDSGDDLASVHGTVTLHGDWPATGEIQVSLFSTWHSNLPINIAPQGPPDFHTEGLSADDTSGQTHQIHFVLPDINPDSYPSLVVGWRDGGQSGVDEPVLGLYGANLAEGDSLPTAIVLEPGDDLELDFDGWLDRIPSTDTPVEEGQISGTVEFSDGWPSGYPAYYVVLSTSTDPAAPAMPRAMAAVSEASPDFLLDVTFSGTFTGGLTVYGYPYGADAWAAFYGGYGWDWDAAQPALVPLTLTEGEPGLGGIVLSCRTDRN